ncbi:MAG: acyl-CoA thioesterase [Eubacterium sp.]|nr:acyl-CoA thioesterase [Eubacterium sp.]MBQ2053445.1 acyl-CoA thioesterase [Eubacterium sp.]MEE3398344.1 acyl-CoA thioesterase [Eubacterium sp.]
MSYESFKKVEDSRTEWMKCIQYEDINGNDRLFGGRLMSWMDEVAGIAATRHCGGFVTTAAVDNLQFKAGCFLNDIIVIRAKLTYVGRTSMEVRVDVYIEDRDSGMRKVINRAYFTEVQVDDAGRPVPLKYGLVLETEVEKAEWEGAKKRLEVRRQRRVEGF